MEIQADYEIVAKDMQKEFKVCPACGYGDGFHSMFRKQDQEICWLLICPACHAVFDIGLKAQPQAGRISAG